jgi:hypothetical protein
MADRGKDELYSYQREFLKYLKDKQQYPRMTSINKPSDVGKTEHAFDAVQEAMAKLQADMIGSIVAVGHPREGMSFNVEDYRAPKERIVRWYHGPTIYANSLMVERVYNPRSPSRARRRAAKGHPQHYDERPMKLIIHDCNGNMHVHPDYAKLLSEHTTESIKHIRDDMFERYMTVSDWSEEPWSANGARLMKKRLGEKAKPNTTDRWAGNRYRK